MKVRLKYGWFAPTKIREKPYGKLNISRSGTFYGRGDHDLPDKFKSILPKSALILDDEQAKEKEEEEPDINVLRDLDEVRAEAESLRKAHEEANSAQARAAKAREAKVAKKEGK